MSDDVDLRGYDETRTCPDCGEEIDPSDIRLGKEHHCDEQESQHAK